MNQEQEKHFEQMMAVLAPVDRAELYDRRNGRLRIDDHELTWPVRFGAIMGRLCVILGPLASQCENCAGSSKTIPGQEAKNAAQQSIFDAMDAVFIGSRHPARCERRIMLKTDAAEFFTEQERKAKAQKIIAEGL